MKVLRALPFATLGLKLLDHFNQLNPFAQKDIKSNINHSIINKNSNIKSSGKNIILNDSNSSLACSESILSCSLQAQDGCCSPKMGLLVLALQWMPNLGPENAFTVHGLWPNNCDGSFGPDEGCDASRNYNIQDIVEKDSSLLEQMNTFWSSYKGDNPAFWKHEWTKHGTCYSLFESKCYDNNGYFEGLDAIDYFKLTLKLRDRFDLYPVLKRNNIVPGRVYSKKEFTTALSKLGGQIELSCKRGTISEVKIYLYQSGRHNFKLINSQRSGNCPDKINYPLKD